MAISLRSSTKGSRQRKNIDMGKKLDALLGKGFKTGKFKATVNLAISRLSVLKNQRQARCNIARSDVVEILKLGNHERALFRVEQVIKEQNMLDVLAMIEGYCHLLIERVHLIEKEKICPIELKEAVSTLIYAATRCGEFPELQELRAIFTSRYGKEFAARAVELRNNCEVNAKMIQKLSTRMPNLENKTKVMKEIASENNIVLQFEEIGSELAEENQQKPNPSTSSGDSCSLGNGNMQPENIEKVEDFSGSFKTRKKYKDVADAAQAAFESAAYAAAAARAAMELSQSDSNQSDGSSSSNVRPRKLSDCVEPVKTKFQGGEIRVEFEKIDPIQKYDENHEEEFEQSKNEREIKRSFSASSSDSDDYVQVTKIATDEDGLTNPAGKEIVFDESDDETQQERTKPCHTMI